MLFFRNGAGDEVEIRKGLTLDSGSPHARQVFCWFHDEMGRAREAVAECRKSVELDPLSPCSGTPITASARTTKPSSSRTKHLKSTPGTVRLLQVLGTHTGRWGTTKRQSSNTSKPGSEPGTIRGPKKLREDFEKNGYKGILRNHAKESEAAGYHNGAAASYAMLAEKGAAFAAQEQAAAAAVIWIPSNLTRRSTISAPPCATPTCCAGSACHRKCPRRYCLAHCGSSSGFTICPSRM